MSRWILLLGCVLLACTGDSLPSAPVGGGAGESLLLARHPELLSSIELPQTSRPGASPIPSRISLEGKWKKRSEEGGVVEWIRPTPFFAEFFNARTSRRPPGMRVFDPAGKAVPFVKVGKPMRPGTWGYLYNRLVIRTRKGESPAGFTVDSPWATEREKSLHRATAGLDDHAFAMRSMVVSGRREHGLYLPAPARACFRVDVSPGLRLRSRASLLPSYIDEGQRSDGVQAEIQFLAEEGTVSSLWVEGLEVGEMTAVDIDLRPHAGKSGELCFVSVGSGSAAYDHLFFSEPSLVQPRRSPRRVALLFADTLRADHVGMYGYERDTTPRLDAWAAERAVVFEQARSVASWTLPSSRAAISGREPERWRDGDHLGSMLAREGFVTAHVSANIYLTDVFGFAEGWSEYHYLPGGDALVKRDRVREIMARYPDRDLAIFVQVMDPHFGYGESEGYRNRFEGKAPGPEFTDAVTEDEVRAAWEANTDPGYREALLEYTRARYDQNIRVVDDAFADLIEDMGPDAVTVFFSDHGEEWYDHGRLAHGHFAWDSSIKVPLAVAGPGLEAGRVSTAVGVTDIVPTVLELLTLEPPGDLDGQSLVPLARPGSVSASEHHPSSFGWGLFGNEVWGSVVGRHKYMAVGPDELLFDVVTDPGETVNLAADMDLAPYRDALSEVRDRRVVRVVRVAVDGPDRMMKKPMRVEISHPEGLLAGWSRWQHMQFGEVKASLRGGSLVVEPPNVGTIPRELYVIPSGSADGLTITARHGNEEGSVTVTGDASPLATLDIGDGIRVDAVWRPLPSEHADVQMDSSLQEALEALGYVER